MNWERYARDVSRNVVAAFHDAMHRAPTEAEQGMLTDAVARHVTERARLAQRPPTNSQN